MRVLTSDDAYNKEKMMNKIINLWCDLNRPNVQGVYRRSKGHI